MNSYDSVVRTIMEEDGCTGFFRQIGIQGKIERLPVKLTRTNAREVNYLGEDAAGVVHHVEFQARNDGMKHSRMLAYMAMIAEKVMELRRQNFEERRGIVRTAPVFPEIRQVVVYIGRQAMRMTSRIKTGNLTYGFSLVDARNLDGQALIDSPAVGDAVLAVLCKDGSKPDVIRQILMRIAEGDPTRKDENGARLLALSGLRDASETVETEMLNMNFQLDLSKIKTFREFNRHGQARLVADQII